MKIEQLLREKGTRIVSVQMSDTVETAARRLRKEHIGAVVVKDVCGTEGDTIVGMFSERDIVRALVDHGATALTKPVWTFMSRRVISCSPHDDVEHAMELMDRHRIRHLPVLDEHTLVGVISIRDFVASYVGAKARSESGVAAGR